MRRAPPSRIREAARSKHDISHGDARSSWRRCHLLWPNQRAGRPSQTWAKDSRKRAEVCGRGCYFAARSGSSRNGQRVAVRALAKGRGWSLARPARGDLAPEGPRALTLEGPPTEEVVDSGPGGTRGDRLEVAHERMDGTLPCRRKDGSTACGRAEQTSDHLDDAQRDGGSHALPTRGSGCRASSAEWMGQANASTATGLSTPSAAHGPSLSQ
jgi:hypothetical protein